MSRLGKQIFLARKRSTNEAAAAGDWSRGDITGRDDFSLRSPACSLQSLICDANLHGISTPLIYLAYVLPNIIPNFLVMSPSLESSRNYEAIKKLSCD